MAIPKIVGLTGGIGSGKSVVRRMLQEKGVPCLDADTATREIHQDPAHPALVEIALAFPDAMTPEGRLSRGSLREVFAVDSGANNRLRSILQPYVIAAMTQWATEQKAPFAVWESALIIEAEIHVDRILVVNAVRELQVARVQARNPDWTRAQIDRILALQLTEADRAPHAHDTIYNNGSLQELKQQVESLHRAYQELWG